MVRRFLLVMREAVKVTYGDILLKMIFWRPLLLFPRRCSTIQALELSFGLSRTVRNPEGKEKFN